MTLRRSIIAAALIAAAACGAPDDPQGLLDPDVDGSAGPTPQAAIVVADLQALDLGTLPGGTTSRASDINESGEIVGSSDTGSGETHAFLIDGGGMTDLGVLPGGDDSSASAINELTQVVGSSSISAAARHAFLWEAGTMTDLGAFPPEDDIDSSSGATGIDNVGFVSGFVDLAGVVWDLDGTPNYPPFPPYVRLTDPGEFMPAVATDINDAGQVSGLILSTASAIRWEAGAYDVLPTLGGILDDRGNAINELGHVVGRSPTGPPVEYHAVLWPDLTTIVDLGTLGGANSNAFDVNDAGFVVGESETSTGETVAFVWHVDLGMQPLGTLGGSNSAAFGLNEAGQIVGEAETAEGDVHAVLWTVTLATEIVIDVKPGGDENPINPRSRGVIPVAVITTDDFDATTVDPATVAFGPGAAPEAHGKGHVEDVDDDGDDDLVLHFRTQASGVACGDTELTLTGETFGGDAVLGTDVIVTVGCH